MLSLYRRQCVASLVGPTAADNVDSYHQVKLIIFKLIVKNGDRQDCI